VDGARFRHVAALLTVQEREARWWRDACLLYFQTFSKREIPPELERPRGTLSEYRAIRHYFVPGI
jgi:alpha-glucuronidase